MRVTTMRAMVLERAGGPLVERSWPVPEVGPDEVLIQVEAAGVGQWDPFEREGGFAQMLDIEPEFPYVLGSEAGTIVTSASASRFREATARLQLGNPKGGLCRICGGRRRRPHIPTT
jgi:NADPH:quinone reductase-like Zn-dependent oxidoreductase